jgi:hypothetical protein
LKRALEISMEVVFEGDDGFEMSPAQLCIQCVHNLEIGEDLGKADHVEEVPASKSPPKLGFQLSLQ